MPPHFLEMHFLVARQSLLRWVALINLEFGVSVTLILWTQATQNTSQSE